MPAVVPADPAANGLVSSLQRQVQELRAALAKERAERDEDANRLGAMLARVGERESQAAAAERREARALARVAALEEEVASAQAAAKVLEEQLRATEASLVPSGPERIAAPAPISFGSAMQRAESAERERDALRVEVERLRERMEEMRGRTAAMSDALEGLKRAVERATILCG